MICQKYISHERNILSVKAELATTTKNAYAATDSKAEEKLKSIAVLPFVNLSPDSDQQYFIDGLSTDLHDLLAKNPYLNLTDEKSIFAFKGSDTNVQEIADKLDAAYIQDRPMPIGRIL